MIIIAAWLGFLTLLVRIGVFKRWAMWMKVSPIAIWIIGQVFLLIPMSFGAPSGPAVVLKNTVHIVPRVSGQVVDVPVKSGVPLHDGGVLFTIDPTPFQTEVKRLDAALLEAQKKAKMLPADLAAATAAVRQTEAMVVAARQQAESLQSSLDAATAVVAKNLSQLELAQADVERARQVIESGATTQAELERLERNQATAQASLAESKARRQQTQLAFNSQVDGVNTSVIEAEAAVAAAQARRLKAQIAVESKIAGEDPEVDQIRAQLELAQLHLSWTKVTAPSDGIVTSVVLRPGTTVVADKSEVMSFVDESEQMIAVQIDQVNLRHVEVGQAGEVIFKLYPGEVFEAEVIQIVAANPAGQISPSGVAMAANSIGVEPFWVELKMKDESRTLPPGAVGSAAIYTDHHAVSHIIRQLFLRMKNWMNFVRIL